MRAKHIASTGAVAALFGLIATALFYWQHWIWGGIFGLLTVAMLQSAFSSKLWVAACPYCSEVFDPLAGLRPDKEGKVVQCKSCFEYSVYPAEEYVRMIRMR